MSLLVKKKPELPAPETKEAAAKPATPAPIPTPTAQEVASLLSARKSVLLGGITSALLVFGFGGWSMLTEISGAVVSSGQIEVAQNRQVVQHPDGGVVAEIAVKEAQQVKAGDLLIKLDGTVVHSELAIVEGQLYEVLARSARLQAERDDAAEPIFRADPLEIAKARPEVAE